MGHTGGVANLPAGLVGGSADYWNRQMTPANLLGLSPAVQSKAAGGALPPVTVAGGDMAMVAWHPDSPLFWLLAIGAATVFGLIGASVEVRAGKRRLVGAAIGSSSGKKET